MQRDTRTSLVETSEGVFSVYGDVSAIKGAKVVIRGLSDNRLKKQLCIKTDCYKLAKIPVL